jgi:starch phosphorylase
MVREYVTELYLPAARSSQALALGGPGFGGARQLAAWKDRVTKAWPGVGIEHVEADDSQQSPGARLAVRASVALGELSPDDVTVQVVYGTAGDEDEIIGPAVSDLTLDPEAAGGSPAVPGSTVSPRAGTVARYVGEAVLGRPGPFGYTVRVLPRHPLLAGPAEMGLVTVPVAPAGMVNGDLR